VYKVGAEIALFLENSAFSRVTKSGRPDTIRATEMTSVVAADRTSFDPLGAGGLLLAVLAVCLGLGALGGLAAGAVGIGVAIGAVVGVPASIAAVYLTYRRSF
jgi:hypothetical protein